MYEQFFPKWNRYYTVMLQQNCSTEVLLYRTLPLGPSKHAACIDTALCMMDHTVKNVESQTASTGVLLGLMPSVLATLGSSPVEMSLLGTRRPLLSFLLAPGAPVVNPIRLFEHVNPEQILVSLSQKGCVIAGEDKNEAARENETRPRIMAISQHFLALAAMINIVMVAVELDTKAYSVVLACRWHFLIYVWTFSAVALHVLAWFALRMRAQFSDQPIMALLPPGKRANSGLGAKLRRWKDNEFSRCTHHDNREFHWAPSETTEYRIITQILAVGTVVQIFFGTAILSGYQFLAPIDACFLILRYIASAWVCRAILGFELSGLASRTIISEPKTAIDTVSHTPGKVIPVVSNRTSTQTLDA